MDKDEKQVMKSEIRNIVSTFDSTEIGLLLKEVEHELQSRVGLATAYAQ